MLKTKNTVSQATLPQKPAVPRRAPRPDVKATTGAALSAKLYTEEDMYEDMATHAATVAKTMPSHGTASRALKAGMAGFASGMKMGSAYHKYMSGKKKKKGPQEESPETISQAAAKPVPAL